MGAVSPPTAPERGPLLHGVTMRTAPRRWAAHFEVHRSNGPKVPPDRKLRHKKDKRLLCFSV